MSFRRSDRVGELLRHEISQYVLKIKDPRLGFVTITSVRLSGDLMDAKVSYSVYGTDEERNVSTKILTHSIPEMRRYLGRKLESLRRVPVLSFVYDDTPEKAQKVESILSRLAGEHEQGNKEETPPVESTDMKEPQEQ